MSMLSFSGSGKLQGTYIPPGDKSISHRALLFAALAEGKSGFCNFLEAGDCLNTLYVLSSLGTEISYQEGSGNVQVVGKGLMGFRAPAKELDFGNSGTSMRLTMGILAGQNFESTLIGDESLSLRPMKRVTTPLKQMGAQIKGKDNGNYAPIIIRGGKLRGIDFHNKLNSAQVKSTLLLAGLYAEGKTRITETLTGRDHTERFLEMMEANFRKTENTLEIKKTKKLKPFEMRIPGDISSAAFFIVGASMTEGSELMIKDVGLNPTRTGIINVLKRMGASLEVSVSTEKPELIGNIFVKGSKLRGTRITREEIPSLIDELPILMVAMAVAEGESLISGAEELRHKETDRINSMITNLKIVGANIEELPDGCLIKGISKLKEGNVLSYGDHRTAMSFAIASLVSNGEISVEDTACIATSYPEFPEHLEGLFTK